MQQLALAFARVEGPRRQVEPERLRPPSVLLSLVGEAERPKPHPTRGRVLPPEVFTPDEIEMLLAACLDRKDTDVRNRALLALMWRSALRIGETLNLRPGDVDGERGLVHVRNGKGEKSRTAALRSLDALDDLQDWLDRRESWRVGEEAPLFCTQKGTPLESSYIRHFLPRLARRAGIERRVHSHAMRHSHSAELFVGGTRETIIQRQLGHADLRTTAIYLQSIAATADELRKQIQDEA